MEAQTNVFDAAAKAMSAIAQVYPDKYADQSHSSRGAKPSWESFDGSSDKAESLCPTCQYHSHNAA